jgi:hypothetical protein
MFDHQAEVGRPNVEDSRLNEGVEVEGRLRLEVGSEMRPVVLDAELQM